MLVRSLFNTKPLTRAYSIASKSRRSKPAFNFESTSPSPPSAGTTLESIPTARSTPSNVHNPGSSTLAAAGAAKRNPVGMREPPLVEAARKKSVKQRNVFESYLVLSWKTRLYFWLVIGGVAVAGLYGGDYFVPETEEEKKLKGEQQTA
ncbi:hypothetical protein JCM3765_002237 [Sporobolomyces pararoseus]